MIEIQVDVVLPCLNEAQALPWILERMPAGYRAIVVDNGSTDGSADLARTLGAHVVHESRRGFGAAAHAGLLAATAPIVAFCDADASMDPRDLSLVVDPIRADEADLVLGRRRPTTRTAWPPHARLANTYLSWRLRRITGVNIHDLGPMRAARRDDLLALELVDRRSGYPLEMVLGAAKGNWRICEVDTGYSPRIGRSKVTGTVRGTLTAIKDMSGLLRANTASSSTTTPGTPDTNEARS
ncbi:glycosyltransferase family 2 protein [Cryobacterium sp. PH31-L1]|uniref:glycosyltransferase family 2 protein n=1 Tax=Cryobacterium sp. PH31-L1 TaxID=3046199 RepID=UPI0024BB2E91|nr:glycosyltransferase family 2 protein [Cryobacterium sp. PH31-L1]MDJ0377191.1 glycosyltransferase family 2 protein [Cryobacterium sp. PH31-L1]